MVTVSLCSLEKCSCPGPALLLCATESPGDPWGPHRMEQNGIGHQALFKLKGKGSLWR